MKSLTLGPLPKLSGTIRLPGSKSLSNRYLLLAALSTGTTRLSDLLDSDDIRAMKTALRALGVGILEADGGRTVDADGIGSRGFQVPVGALDLGNAGTAMRPLAAGRGHDPRDHGALRRPAYPQCRDRLVAREGDRAWSPSESSCAR
jgi:3-phosphoshikimate 1-carboxyvinyltransferase